MNRIDPLAARSFAAVTTCHAAGFDLYGRRMVQTYLDRWHGSVPLHVYTEGFALPADLPQRLYGHDLERSSPELVAFKARHRDHPMAHGLSSHLHWNPKFGAPRRGGDIDLKPMRRLHGYRWDAVRFAHKVFALTHAARHVEADVLIWLDADTHFFADVSTEQLETFVPTDCFVGCLRRTRKYSECGFVAYNLRHPATAGMLAQLEAMYTDDLLFREREFHDAYLFDVVRERIEGHGHRSYDIARGLGGVAAHVLVNSPLGAFMDHLKGDRKDSGASRRDDLVVHRAEPYWNDAR